MGKLKQDAIDNYFCKLGEKGHYVYAYIHVDNDFPDLTFLIQFASSEAETYIVYTTCDKNDKEKDEAKSMIMKFLLNICSNKKTTDETCVWKTCNNPKMVLHEKTFEIVEEITKQMNDKKQKRNEYK